MSNLIDILFLGDIVGRPGRKIVEDYLNKLQNGEIQYGTPNQIKSSPKPDFIIANVENASHGFGLTTKNHNDLGKMGINAYTSGNHIWDRKEVFDYIDESDKLIRPLNYPQDVPGVGSRIFAIDKNTKIGVISLLGRVFMTPVDSPWEKLKTEVEKLKKITPVIFVDFHAEATAEKISMGHYGNELGISAIIGTHTHVQTADEKILNKGTAYLTDAGFCGASNGVIGMDITSSLKRLTTNLPERFDVAPMEEAEVNGVRIIIDKSNGCAQYIERIKFYKNLSEEK